MSTRGSDLDPWRLSIIVDGDGHATETGEEGVVTTWEEVNIIGGGAFGSVGLEKTLVGGKEEVRAVKKLLRDRYIQNRLDFSRELRALIAVQDHHDLFIRFIGWYENRYFYFIAMEYAKYGDLGHYIKESKQGAGYEVDVLDITKQLLEALSVLHSKGYVHRDLKPQNILITSLSPLQVKLADFGASKSTIDSRLHTQCGTSGYMAPEMLGYLARSHRLGRKYPYAVDMWSLGCIVYEIFTGKVPFLVEDVNPTNTTGYTTNFTGTTAPGTGGIIDWELLSRFCSGKDPFPIDILESYKVDDWAIDFIGRLLAAGPQSRMPAEEALKHRWLVGIELPIPKKKNTATPEPVMRQSRHPRRDFFENDQVREVEPIPYIIKGDRGLLEFRFRVFHAADPNYDPSSGSFDNGRTYQRNDDYTPGTEWLQEYLDPTPLLAKPTPPLETTPELLQAIHIAETSQRSGNEGVSIAIIGVQGSWVSRSDGPAHSYNTTIIIPQQIPAAVVIGCLSLDKLIEHGLYQLVPELNSDGAVGLPGLRMKVKQSQWQWETKDRLKDIGYRAARVAQCFGSGIHTKVIAIEVAEWWDAWWPDGIIDKEIIRVLESECDDLGR